MNCIFHKRDAGGKPIAQSREEAIARFWSMVDMSGGPDACWPWKGPLTVGYGWFSAKALGRRKRSARHAWELANGREMPRDMEPDHLCRNRPCCNPKHLEEVTAVENTMRGESPHARHARQTHCIHGHPFTPENTRTYLSRGRYGITTWGHTKQECSALAKWAKSKKAVAVVCEIADATPDGGYIFPAFDPDALDMDKIGVE